MILAAIYRGFKVYIQSKCLSYKSRNGAAINIIRKDEHLKPNMIQNLFGLIYQFILLYLFPWFIWTIMLIMLIYLVIFLFPSSEPWWQQLGILMNSIEYVFTLLVSLSGLSFILWITHKLIVNWGLLSFPSLSWSCYKLSR